jgi:transposase
MHDVPDIHAIRTLYQQGHSKRAIARLLHVSRKTVDKYTDPAYVVPTEVRMKLQKPRPSPKLDPWKPVLAQWLAEDAQRPRKQRRTARKMYQDLVALYGESFGASEASVRRYVAQLKQERAQKAYVPLAFPPGAMMQGDFGHALVILAGQEQTLPFFAARLMASSPVFVKVYWDEKLEAVLDGVVSALGFFGGVPKQFLFDNPSTLVQKILGGGQRLQTPEFKALQAHYGFEAVFCNPRAAHEKGGVESAVQWALRNLFSPVPQASSIHELNAALARQCLADAQRRTREGRLVADLWAEERTSLGPLPRAPFPACRHRFVRVDKTLLCTYDRAVYSVPPDYAGKSLLLRAYWDRIEIADRERTVAVHERQRPGGYSLRLEHYLPVLAHKPRAVGHAAVIARGEPAIARYRDAFLAQRPGAYRELVAILQLATSVGVRRLAEALATASRYRAYDIDSVRALLAMEETAGDEPPVLDAKHLQRWPQTPVQPVDSAAYGWLTPTAAGGEPA